MLCRISDRFHTWAKGWLISTLIAGFILLSSLNLFDPALVARSLDGQFGYTPQDAFSAVASYGEAGRIQMIWLHAADLLLIGVYTTMFSLAISWLFQRGFLPGTRMQKLNLVPLMGGFFDVMENIWIVTMIGVYPAQPAIVGWLSAISTACKYIMGIPILLLLAVGVVKAAANRFSIQEAEV